MTRVWRFLDAAVVPVAITPAVITALRHAEALPFLSTHTMTAPPVLFSGVGLMIDGFAERQAQAYTAVLSSAVAAHAAGLR